MTLNNVVFINQFPKLDLHGLDKESAEIYIKEFIRDNLKLKNKIIVIVHGIGKGILKKVTHQQLTNNKDVIEFKTFYYNHGCTLVQLKIK